MFVFVTTLKIKPDHISEARDRAQQVTELVRAEEPQMHSISFFLDEARGELAVVQVHPDADSMSTHMRVVAQHLADAWNWLDSTTAQYAFGGSPEVLTRYAAEHNEPLVAIPEFVAGFTR